MKAATLAAALLATSLQAGTMPAASANELAVVGTGDGMEMLSAIAAAYSADNPGKFVKIPPSIGSGGGIRAVGTDTAVLARIARPLTQAEMAEGLIYMPVARINSAIYAHPGAGVKALTGAQVVAIFAGKITNWREVGGADLRIRVVRREDADSTLQVLREFMPGWKTLEFTEKSKLSTTTQDALQSVQDNPGAIGFGPFSRSLESGVVVVAVDGKHPRDNAYPSGVTLALVFKKKNLTADAETFLAYARGAKARALIAAFGAIPQEP
jgi:phosphate transport system substrate-binding protein